MIPLGILDSFLFIIFLHQNQKNNENENVKQNTQSLPQNPERENLKKQLTDKTFKAPSNDKMSDSEISAELTTYLITDKKDPDKKMPYNEYLEIEKSNTDGNILFSLKRDDNAGTISVANHYLVDKNGYEYDSTKKAAYKVPLTNLYIDKLL
ncbi:hypothetical protein [Bacillus mycoides]|uniref:Viral A-type inclusion protein n=1 Tax=Bacillus mycoides TaxID=1405 RepID=A0A1G4ES76_BACMY|nr:hypothetical protein [Bacillus mycoides]SCB68909.1 Viral A-type inclusion protein [Bacillus mycoides]